MKEYIVSVLDDKVEFFNALMHNLNFSCYDVNDEEREKRIKERQLLPPHMQKVIDDKMKNQPKELPKTESQEERFSNIQEIIGKMK